MSVTTATSHKTQLPKILVVDDRRENLFAMETLLKPLGADVVTALSGNEALSQVLRHSFVLILMDVQMPDMDGFETASLIREYENSRQIPIIFVTAISKEQKYISQGYKLGAVDYLFKPIDPDILQSKVRVFLELHHEKTTLSKVLSELTRTQAELEQNHQELAEAHHQTTTAKSYLDNIIRSMTDALLVMNPNMTIRSVNPATVALLGFEEKDLVGQPPNVILGDETLQGTIMEELVKSGSVRDVELTFVTKDQKTIPVSFSGSVLQDDQGRLQGIVCLAQDITKRKLVETEIAEARDRALETARLKSEFLATVSHEIRTPMNGVMGMTELLLDTELTAEQREYAETTKAAEQGLLTIINDILDFSKIDAHKLRLEVIDFDLRTAVEEVMELMAGVAQRKGLELVGIVYANVPNAVQGDPGRLRQVLTNLVGNAIKFTNQGEIVLHVSSEEETDKDLSVRFDVTDTGIGISHEGQGRLFQPFMQADGSTSRKYGGTGLGLAICKQLIEMMGGEFGVYSEPDHGSLFWFTVRLAKQSLVAQTLTPREDLQGLRVCLVDDNGINHLLLQYYAKAWGMRSEIAQDGADALERLHAAYQQGDPFDLAILAMQMPKMNGCEVAQAIKADPHLASTQVILYTPLGIPGDGRAAQETGVAAYLTKPIRQSQLHQVLCLVMGKTTDIGMTLPDSPPLITQHSLKETQLRRQGRVLLAEDKPINQKVAVRMLEKLGYRVDVVGNGREAIEAMTRFSYQLILMDCMMPEVDGFEATKEIRKQEGQTRHTPIIAMTANAFMEDREKCLEAGMDDYMAKPVNLENLDAMLKRWTPQGPEGAAMRSQKDPSNVPAASIESSAQG